MVSAIASAPVHSSWRFGLAANPSNRLRAWCLHPATKTDGVTGYLLPTTHDFDAVGSVVGASSKRTQKNDRPPSSTRAMGGYVYVVGTQGAVTAARIEGPQDTMCLSARLGVRRSTLAIGNNVDVSPPRHVDVGVVTVRCAQHDLQVVPEYGGLFVLQALDQVGQCNTGGLIPHGQRDCQRSCPFFMAFWLGGKPFKPPESMVPAPSHQNRRCYRIPPSYYP